MAEEVTADAMPQPLPTWLSIPIILVCLAGGGWIIHWYVLTDPVAHESKMLGEVAADTQFTRPRGRNVIERSITSSGNGRWDLQTEQAHAVMRFPNGKPGAIIQIDYARSPANNAIVPANINALRTIIRNPDRLAAMKFTPAQQKRLTELQQPIHMKASDADRDALVAVMTPYVSAKEGDRPALQPKVLQTLDEIAQRSLAATKQAASDASKEIDTIITPEQWKLNASLGDPGQK